MRNVLVIISHWSQESHWFEKTHAIRATSGVTYRESEVQFSAGWESRPRTSPRATDNRHGCGHGRIASFNAFAYRSIEEGFLNGRLAIAMLEKVPAGGD